MIGMNATISNSVLKMLKQNGKKQNELAEALGISKQVMSNMLSGTRMINAIELHQIADFFHVPMEKLMESSADVTGANAVHAFMGEVKSDDARESLRIADELADMILFYKRVSANAMEMEQAWEV